MEVSQVAPGPPASGAAKLSLSLWGLFFHFRSGGGDELWQYVINCVRSGGISPCHIDMRRRDPRCKVQSSTASSFPFCFSQFGHKKKQ